MAGHRRGGLKKHKHPSLDIDSKDKFEDLLVFGYACKLFRDDDRALQIDQGSMLIPWMGDDSIKIDRYDARGTLSDLKSHEAPQGGFDPYEGLTPEERRLEKLIDEERYFALYKNEEEEATLKEEEEKRLQQDLHQVTSQEVTYNQVPFSYSDHSTEQSNGHGAPQKSTIGDLGDAIYVPPPGLDVPPGTVVPPTQKLARVVLKTAAFISTQGAQMEIIVKAKQANNPMFQFLHFDCVLHPFYRHVLAAIRSGSYTVPPDEEDSSATGTSTADANGLNKRAEGDNEEADSDDENYLHPSLQPKKVEILESVDPGPDVQPLIDKTASYLARKGRHLEPLLLSKGDARFNFLNAEHSHHAYYVRKLNLYVDMWSAQKSPKSQLVDDQDKENSSESSNQEVEDQQLKNERRKKAALFLNKLRQNKSAGGVTGAEVKAADDSTKGSETTVSQGSTTPEQSKPNQSTHSDEVEIIGLVAKDSTPRSRSASRSPVRHRKHRSRSRSPVRPSRRARSRTPSASPSPRRSRSRSRSSRIRSRSHSRSRSRSDDRRRRHHKKRRDRSRDRSASRRHHHRRERKHRRDTSRDRASRKKKTSRRKRSPSVSRSRSRSATRSSVSASPTRSPAKRRPTTGDTISATRRTSPSAVGGAARKLAGASVTSSSETSSPLPPQLMTLQPALAKMAEGLRAKVIAMIDGDQTKK